MKTIVVVGVGALGSHLVQFIRNVDANIRVIDFDRIEAKNTMSQFHGSKSKGKGKAQALGQLMNFLFDKKIETIPHKLTKNNDKQMLGGADLIIDCLDNAPARIIVQNFAKENNIQCLHGALAANGDFGRVVWSESFIIDEGPEEGAATCEDGEHLPFIGLTATLLAQAAKTYMEKGDKNNYSISPGGVIKL